MKETDELPAYLDAALSRYRDLIIKRTQMKTTTPITNHTNTLLALYALLDTPHAARARREIEQIMDEITAPDYDAERAHLLQQEEDSMARLLAEIAEQDGVNNDEADFYDPSDRF